MKQQFLNLKAITLCISALLLITSCSDTDDGIETTTEIKDAADRWITIAGARMGDEPGDGNGGTLIYALSSENAKDPEYSVDVFNYGFVAPSNRTARLQASEDGSTIFNISYAGDTGGNYTKYTVNGGQNFTQTGSEISIAEYVGTAPRWVKLFDGDQTGCAVRVDIEHTVDDNGTAEDVTDDSYIRTSQTVGIVTLDLVNSSIKKYEKFELSIGDDLESQGYYIGRIDMPVLNAAGDKLYIGARMNKIDPATLARDEDNEVDLTSDSDYQILGSKTIIVDYPSLENPVVVTSTLGHGDTNGYRSINAFEYNGAVYQANQSDPEGSYILKIGADNQYDDTYNFNLDDALGITGAYVLAWRPAGNGKAVLAYRHDGSAEGVAGAQGFFALVDLNTKTATKIDDIPYDPDFYLFQYQSYAVDGNEIYLTQAPVGQNGNIYVVDTETGDVTKGAQLINATGSHFIGAW